MGDKKIGNQRRCCLRPQHGRSLHFFVSPFFVIFLLMVWLNRRRRSLRKALILRVLAQPIFRIISGRYLQRAGNEANRLRLHLSGFFSTALAGAACHFALAGNNKAAAKPGGAQAAALHVEG
jgi:hypothetical protein